MKWTHIDNGSTVAEVVMKHSGLTEEELLHPTPTQPEAIENLPEAAQMILDAIHYHTPISVMGDYDADGVTSSAILYYLLSEFGVTPRVRLPHRMSEGYGLSENAIEEFEVGLLITVDNGIAAHDAIQTAKKKGFQVIILDHHLPTESLPEADIIVDPHVHPNKNGFTEYCGAGLAYKLAQYMLKDSPILEDLCALAAIGTVGDAMVLHGDNRYIVKEGLKHLANGKGFWGLPAIIESAEVYSINESDIGFRIAPMLNAAGRMLDDGAHLAFQTLTSPNKKIAKDLAEQLKKLNEQRKLATTVATEEVEGIIAADALYCEIPLVIYAEGLHEGLVGIITGKIAEKYKVPTFILTDSEDENILKGSGRSYGGVNLKEDILDKLPSGLLYKGGGHAEAAGISVKRENLEEFFEAMRNTMADIELNEVDALEYDLEIAPGNVKSILREVSRFAPYGVGCPAPTFLVKGITLSPRAGKIAKYMGKNAEHLKLHGPQFSALCFGRAEDYRNMGCPGVVDVIGTISENVFRYAAETQIEAKDFRIATPANHSSTLLDALLANGTI